MPLVSEGTSLCPFLSSTSCYGSKFENIYNTSTMEADPVVYLNLQHDSCMPEQKASRTEIARRASLFANVFFQYVLSFPSSGLHSPVSSLNTLNFFKNISYTVFLESNDYFSHYIDNEAEAEHDLPISLKVIEKKW